MAHRAPIVGVSCDRKLVGEHPFQMAGEKYLSAVRGGSGAVPLLIPSLTPALAAAELLAAVDGLLFTGAVSNVGPQYYGGEAPRAENVADPERDATTLPLVRAALDAGVPCLFICRGHQELNVALGGSLHQHVKELPGRLDHTAVHKTGLDEKYGPAHAVRLTPGGRLEAILGSGEFSVNSLHEQAIDRLGEGLAVEALAPDGTIEAVSLPGAKAFALGLQWHPEWHWAENAQSRAIFAAFGAALRDARR